MSGQYEVELTRPLERVPLVGHVDKGFAGAEFERWMAARGAHFLRPDRKTKPRRHGALGAVRQWIESGFWTCKGQLGPGLLAARMAQPAQPNPRAPRSLRPVIASTIY